MPLNSKLVPLLAMTSARPRVSYLTADPVQLRAGLRATAAQAAPEPPIEMAAVTDGTLSGPAGPLRTRTYRPGTEPTATMAFFHGGALVAGDVDTRDARSYPGLIHAFGAMYHIAQAADAALDELAGELVARVPAFQGDGRGR
jgi:hypothetical protein